MSAQVSCHWAATTLGRREDVNNKRSLCEVARTFERRSARVSSERTHSARRNCAWRQADANRCAFTRCRFDLDAAARFAHDGMRDEEPEAGAQPAALVVKKARTHVV